VATYVYALLRAPAEPALAGAPRGLPEAGPARLLPLDDAPAGRTTGSHRLWLLVADAPLERYRQAAIERGLRDLTWVSACALGHERMVEHFTAGATVLPMKLFTLFRGDERARAHVAEQRRKWDALLDRVAGRREWGVRLSLDERQALLRAKRRPETARGQGAGTRFLMAKSRVQARARQVVEEGRSAAEETFAALSRLARETRRRPPGRAEAGWRPLLDAAFLVEEGRSRSFQEAVRRRAERLDAEGYRLVLTGPWPAYNFLDDRP